MKMKMNRPKLPTLITACAVAGLIVQPAFARPSGDGATPAEGSGGLVPIAGLTPTVVLNGTARLLRPHPSLAPLSVNLSLPLRNQASLDAFIANQASQGIYMTNEQFDAAYAPTPALVQAVESWGAAHGLQTTYASPDGVLITLRGMTSAVETALHTTINDYRGPDGAQFFANSSDPLLPASLGIVSLDGLNSIPRFHTLSRAALKTQMARALSVPAGGYFPKDFRVAYDAGHTYDGTGQVIGLTLWGAPVPNSDLASFAAASGDPLMTGQVVTTPSNTGADQIEWVFTNGTDSTTDAQGETAMDVEYSHGMAPHAHLVYYLGNQTGVCPNCSASDVSLENAISQAANNAAIHVVSDSWGGGEASSTTDPFTANTESSFEHAVAVGTTFYFSSGDSGTDSGGTGLPSYPADSPYVVSVGGTALHTTASGAYSAESVWNTSPTEGGGAGCSAVFSRPSWQTWSSANHPNGAPACSGRAEPDVSMDADPATGADVYYSGKHEQMGGTSLAAPLFTGLAAVADRYASVNGLTRIGWAAPKLYTEGNSSSYSSAFHDITVGQTAGIIPYIAQTGWDQATGWGSIDWWNWVRATVSNGGGNATPTNTPPSAATATNTSIIGNNCATSGGTQYCLTGLTASASSVPVGTIVTLTAGVRPDRGPSPWYLNIADESGAVLARCGSGSSCIATVSAGVAITHHYTSYLSTSPGSISSHVATSNTVAVSWTGGADPTPTDTPGLPALPPALPLAPPPAAVIAPPATAPSAWPG